MILAIVGGIFYGILYCLVAYVAATLLASLLLILKDLITAIFKAPGKIFHYRGYHRDLVEWWWREWYEMKRAWYLVFIPPAFLLCIVLAAVLL